ncbi:MAG: NAD(P)/FAD-dependent oxidoreductase [Solirubrobacterales bacterium]
MQFYDLAIVGGGVAGISAAIKAKESGIDSIVILESENELGGNLNQCIHSGFGFEIFDDNLTGTEFCQRLIDKVIELQIEYRLNTTVIEINKNKTLTAVNSDQGVFQVKWKALVFAAGCIESTKNALKIAGSKMAGVYTAGTVQRMINIEGYLPGKEAVVIGSHDFGLIMARSMIIEGAKVKAVIEKSGAPKGSIKSVEDCIKDFNIPLLLNYDVIDVKGKARVEEINVAKIDEAGFPVSGTERNIPCDTVILSVDLVPHVELLENAGIEMDSNGLFVDIDGIFVCGDANHIHEHADGIVIEGREAGLAAFRYITEKTDI